MTLPSGRLRVAVVGVLVAALAACSAAATPSPATIPTAAAATTTATPAATLAVTPAVTTTPTTAASTCLTWACTEHCVAQAFTNKFGITLIAGKTQTTASEWHDGQNVVAVSGLASTDKVFHLAIAESSNTAAVSKYMTFATGLMVDASAVAAAQTWLQSDFDIMHAMAVAQLPAGLYDTKTFGSTVMEVGFGYRYADGFGAALTQDTYMLDLSPAP